jgi:hypothetical protein
MQADACADVDADACSNSNTHACADLDADACADVNADACADVHVRLFYASMRNGAHKVLTGTLVTHGHDGTFAHAHAQSSAPTHVTLDCPDLRRDRAGTVPRLTCLRCGTDRRLFARDRKLRTSCLRMQAHSCSN